MNSSDPDLTGRSMDRDRDELDNNAHRMNDDQLRDDEIVELRQQLSDAHARIEQLEQSILRLSTGAVDTTMGAPTGAATGTASSSGTTDHRSSEDDDAHRNDTSLLLDSESRLFSEAYFNVALDARLAAAKRHLRPVSIALIEMTEGTAANRIRIPSLRGADAIRDTLRDADTACRLTDGVYALILEDTPENGAVWTVERIRRNLISRFGPHTMWAGVACYPAHAFSASELLTQARTALNAAKDWNQDRIEVAIAE